MKRNRRAVTRTPLADSYFTPRVVVSTIADPLPQAELISWLFGLTRDATEVSHRVAGDRLKLRTRNKVTLPFRAIPKAGDRTPRDATRVATRLDMKGAIDSRNALEFGTFLTAPSRERLVAPRKITKHARLASDSEREEFAKAERERLRDKARAKRRRRKAMARRKCFAGFNLEEWFDSAGET